MKANTITLAVITQAVATLFCAAVRGQGFLNLDFESAYGLPGNPGGGELVYATNGLPGWSTYDDGVPLSAIFYTSNSFTGTAEAVGLEGGSLALSGDFSAALYLDGSISQTATVPDGAESLEFDASSLVNLQLTLGGDRLSYSVTSVGPGYIVCGANIPGTMAGQMETLTFGINGSGETRLDDIQFSTSPIPEPGKWALIGVGTMVFYIRTLLRTGLRGARRERRGSIAAGNQIWTGWTG